jgi:hypothetical protein
VLKAIEMEAEGAFEYNPCSKAGVVEDGIGRGFAVVSDHRTLAEAPNRMAEDVRSMVVPDTFRQRAVAADGLVRKPAARSCYKMLRAVFDRPVADILPASQVVADPSDYKAVWWPACCRGIERPAT